MTSGREFAAAAVILPVLNSDGVKCIAVLAVTTSSQSVDLRTLFGSTAESKPSWASHLYTLQADMPANADSRVYVALGASSAGSISETATGNGNTVCWPIPDKQSLPGAVLSGRIGVSGMATSIMSSWLYYKGLATGYLRIYRSSVLPGQGVGEFPPPV